MSRDTFWANLTDYVIDGYRREAFPCCGLRTLAPCPECGRTLLSRLSLRWKLRRYVERRGVLVRGRPVLWGARRHDWQIVPVRPVAPWYDDYFHVVTSYRFEAGLMFASGRSYAILTGLTS